MKRGEAYQSVAKRGEVVCNQIAPDVRCFIRAGVVNADVHISCDNDVGDSRGSKVAMQPNGDNTRHYGQVYIHPQGWDAPTT